ncbi:ATP-binding protein [Candidatus Marinarcus aquaticus]|uniref:histidine kinase n=1 Tax=Candidatus Marinarcus aquaticus TaxID=2044504 RepID=A0A4Q0XVP2_9BACT|nr:ATP-binding protein [Candidatus Marinarcus aquaticus]RXJ59931.1 hypothetical protein CRV04_02640 [Candidatus Marinarcus aquaticus]
MTEKRKNINYLLYTIIITLIVFSLFAFKELLGSIENIEEDIFQTQAHTNEKNMQSLMSDKQNSTLSIALVLSQDRSVQNFLLNGEGVKVQMEQLSQLLKEKTHYRSTWIHIIDKNGTSLYRSWTKKAGDNVLNVRKDLQRMHQNPKIMNTISTGIFDMTFKSMVPIFKNETFIGSVEVITKFNSITKKIQADGIEPIILVDKTYKNQLKKPYTKLFIDDYYVANINVNSKIVDYVRQKGVERFWAKNSYETMDGYFVSYYHIKDIDGKLMATTVFFSPLHEVQTGHLDYFKNIALVLSFSAIVGFVLSMVLIYNYLKRQEQVNLNSVLRTYNQKLKSKIKKEIENSRKKDIIVAQQSRLVALGEMIGNIAHQWRQPLSAISTATSGLQIKYEFGNLNKEEFLELTNGIMHNTKFLSDTIEDFRTFFQKDKEQVNFSLSTLVFETYNIIKALYNTQHIDVFFDLDESIMYRGYKSELSQVLLNLFNNSKDALAQVSNENKMVYIKTYETKEALFLEFHDSGGGVDEQYNEKIFDPYFTTKHQSNGTGIGLYMSKEIISKHFDGDISNQNAHFVVDGKEYFGANFVIVLPKV